VKRPDRFGPRRLAVIIACVVVLMVLAILSVAMGLLGLAAIAAWAALGGLIVVLGPRGFSVVRPSPPPGK
jgi:membrane associated rhomboid family serine protease